MASGFRPKRSQEFASYGTAQAGYWIEECGPLVSGRKVPLTGLGPMAAQRRLAAILCLDIAGYSRLMRDDEAATLRILQSLRDLADKLIDQYDGKIANTAGDAIVASFASVTEAMNCAVNIQMKIGAVNAQVREERRAWFRIGLNVGEVTERGGDIFGDGVNVAARLESLAQEGTICISGVGRQMLGASVQIEYQDLGLKSFKNVDTPIPVYLARPKIAGEQALPRPHRAQEIYLARRFFNLLFDAVRDAERIVGLEFLDAPVLVSADDQPGIDEREISVWLAISRAKARAIIARLAKRGLVELRPNGSGKPGLHLSEHGEEVRARIWLLIQAAQDSVMTPLSEQEREELRRLLGRVIKASDALQ